MKCKDVRENLMDVLAGEQAAPEVLAHLRQCDACAQELQGLRGTVALLDEWQAPEPSPYFLTRLHAHAREERGKAPQRGSIFTWLRKPALAVAAAVVLVAGVLTIRTLGPGIVDRYNQVGAVSDVENLDKNADVYVNNDLIDEMTGGPSDDVAEP